MRLLSLFFLSSLLFSCSMNKFVVGQMTPVFVVSAGALYEETDLALAEQAIGSNLKLLEGLLKNDPENEQLLLLLAQGYAGYALGFIEDEDPVRARFFYERSFNFARRALIGGDHGDWKWSKENKEKIEMAIKESGEKELPALFWLTFAMGGNINVSLDDPAALINVNIIEAAIVKIESLNPGFFYGSIYLLKGSIFGMKPRMLGGNPEKALESFDKNLAFTKGNFLLSYIYKAKFYAAKTLDEQLFDDLIEKVEFYEIGTKPEIALFNQIAKKKARLLKAQKDDLF